MQNFNYFAPTQVVFGRGSEDKLAQLVKKYGGTKVLVHYGGQSGGLKVLKKADIIKIYQKAR